MRTRWLAIALLALPAAGRAFEFRSMVPFTASGVQVPGLPPLDSETLKDNISQLAEAWNTPDFNAYVSPNFQDLDRLVMNLLGSVPKDASMELLELQSFDVVNQQTTALPGGGWVRTSLVVAQVLLQISFTNDQFNLQLNKTVQILRLQVKETFQ
jgi:hypothetical protein